MRFRQEVSDQRSLQQGETLPWLLTRLGQKAAKQKHSLATLRIMEMHHERQILKLTSDAPVNRFRFSDVQRFNLPAVSPPKHIYPRNARELLVIAGIKQILF
jgi:hypothetical protein